MAINNQFQALLRAKIIGAIEAARAASTITHPGLKGTALEILVRDLFRPLLPSDIGVGTGQIIECASGKLSNQIDIILYDKSILPPVLFDEFTGIFPIEAVLYAIEVKTKLSRAGLVSAHEHAKNLHSFSYLPPREGLSSEHQCERVRSVVFALDSDLRGSSLTEPKRYKQIYGSDPIYLVALCVAGREYWYQYGDAWIGCAVEEKYDEVLGFLAGVTNTYRDVARSRGYPPLGRYISPTSADSKFSLFPTREATSLTLNGMRVTISDGPVALSEREVGAQPTPSDQGIDPDKPTP